MRTGFTCLNKPDDLHMENDDLAYPSIYPQGKTQYDMQRGVCSSQKTLKKKQIMLFASDNCTQFSLSDLS